MPSLPDSPEKTLHVLRILVSECLKRAPSNTLTTQAQIIAKRELTSTGIQLLRVLVKGKPLYLVSDAWRFAEDFQKVLELPFVRIIRAEDLNGVCNQTPANVVILNTGSKTATQQRIYSDILVKMDDFANLTRWFVSEWR